MNNWPKDDNPVDPALIPLIQAGQGESEGFELAEQALIRHATDEDGPGTAAIFDDVDPRVEDDVEATYGEADSEAHSDA